MADLAEPDRAEAERRIAEVKALNERLVATALGEAENAGQPGVGGRSAPEDGLGPALRSTPPAQAAPFNAFAPFVKTRWDDRWLYVESDGLPHAPGAKSAGAYAYPLMVGIKSWQQQVPLPQAYVGDNAWRIPLKPELADQAISGKTRLYRGAIALAANGVPIFNALNNRGDDAFKAGELDEYGGHCGRADDYHYHIAPLALQKVVGKNRPIAYALDGFPIFGLFDPAARAGEDKACPLGGTEKLDELNGHFGAPTPGSPSGTKGLYHYHASVLYPYINGGVRGKVTVKDDQIDPQPRANPVRQWLQPLRGAAITGFKTLGERSWSLEYTLSSKKHFVNFRIEGQGRDAKYIFEFIGPTGEKTTETYQARAPRTDRPPRDRPAGNRGGRGDRPPGDDAPRPRPPGDGEPPTLAAAPIVKPFDGFVLSSPDVTGGRLSVECTCDGNGRAPALAWEGSPKETKAFAVIVHHVPPEGGAHVYMVVANISATSGKGELKSGDTTTGTWGQNTVNRRSEYAPPCSKGPGDKVYTITLYALSTEVTVPRDRPLTRETLLAAMKDKTLATSTLDVKYARSGAGGRRGG
ncbi:MAG TPA: YHYH protein [Phycisphaerales bacterium]|nr:YHYH protein [Phycisphaerales bacterium]